MQQKVLEQGIGKSDKIMLLCKMQRHFKRFIALDRRRKKMTRIMRKKSL